MGFTPRPIKATGSDSYQQEVANGKLDIIDGELDDDIGTLYSLINGNLSDPNISPTAAIAYSKLNLTGQIRDADISSPADFGNTGGISGSKIRLPFPTSTTVITNVSQIAVGATVAATVQQPANGPATEGPFTYPDLAEHVLAEVTWSARGGFWIALAVVHLDFPVGNVQSTHTTRLRYESSAAGVPDGNVLHVVPGVCGVVAGTVNIRFPITGVVFGQGFSTAGTRRMQLTGQIDVTSLGGLPVAHSRRIWVMEQA
jgi:hypothetical protein